MLPFCSKDHVKEPHTFVLFPVYAICPVSINPFSHMKILYEVYVYNLFLFFFFSRTCLFYINKGCQNAPERKHTYTRQKERYLIIILIVCVVCESEACHIIRYSIILVITVRERRNNTFYLLLLVSSMETYFYF